MPSIYKINKQYIDGTVHNQKNISCFFILILPINLNLFK